MIGYCARISDATSVKNAGFDFLEVAATQIPFGGDTDFPIVSMNNIIPRSLSLFSGEDQIEHVLELLDSLFGSARVIGLTYATFGSGSSRRIAGSRPSTVETDRFSRLLRGIDELANKHGVGIGIEPLCLQESNFINTIAEAMSWIDSLDLRNVGITADSHHILSIPGQKGDLVDASDRIGHIHIADGTERVSPERLSDTLKHFLDSVMAMDRQRNIAVETHWNLPAAPHRTLVTELRGLGF